MPTVIFDFDGTLALGSGPIDAYAASLAEVAGIDGVADAVAASRARFAEGDPTIRDEYHAVRVAADSLGLDEDTLGRGYRLSRTLLATDRGPIDPVPGLGEFMDRLASVATLVLVTNAPDTRLEEALDFLGVVDVFADVVHSARKPVGIEATVREALTRGAVLSVGDMYVNDLAPAAALGADTALVGVTASAPPGPVTMAGASIVDLYVDIEQWAATHP